MKQQIGRAFTPASRVCAARRASGLNAACTAAPRGVCNWVQRRGGFSALTGYVAVPVAKIRVLCRIPTADARMFPSLIGGDPGSGRKVWHLIASWPIISRAPMQKRHLARGPTIDGAHRVTGLP